jgi:hypothetical protein
MRSLAQLVSRDARGRWTRTAHHGARRRLPPVLTGIVT